MTRITACYVCSIYITERENSLIIDTRHHISKMPISGKYIIHRQNHDLFTQVYAQFSSEFFIRKSFINFSIRKMIYDAISQWHPKWNQVNTYKAIQDKLFPKNVINAFKEGGKMIFLTL
jgi:hypothetical protein